MTDDLTPRIPRGAHETEHDLDPRDMADAYAILDGEALARCDGCGQARTACRCCWVCNAHPCRCGPPLSQAEIRAMYGADRAQRVVRR